MNKIPARFVIVAELDSFPLAATTVLDLDVYAHRDDAGKSCDEE